MMSPRHPDADDHFQQELEAGARASTSSTDSAPPVDAQPDPNPKPPACPRLHVLLTQDREHPDEHWTRQIPRLLSPLGIEAQLATNTQQAVEATQAVRFHAIVLDLATPAGPQDHPHTNTNLTPPASGLWLLEVLKRLEHTPPTLVVNAPAPPKQAQRLLNEALRLGAFAVINRPVQLNTLLGAIQRILHRHHQNHWPQT